jgi:hypothetical protein
MLVDYQNHLSQVARLLKGYVESVSEVGQTPDFLFAYPLIDAKSDPEMYFTFFAAIKGFPFVVEEDGQRTPSSTRFPLVDEFRKASMAFLDKMHRKSVLLERVWCKFTADLFLRVLNWFGNAPLP